MKLQTVLDQIDSQEIALPEFQRGYVWNRQQVRGLLTSLYRGYPVGGFMTWNTSVASANARGGEIQRDGAVKLLLDGQQRATTLYGVIRGRAPRFFEGRPETFLGLHFNVQDESFEFYAPSKMAKNAAWVDVTALMARGPIGYFGAINELADGDTETQELYLGRLNRLHQIQQREVHIEEVTGQDKTIDVVVDIFNRVNSGGTKLSKGDLALAKICASWPQARDEMNAHRKRWESAGYHFSLEWLLRNVNAVVTGQALFSALADVGEDRLRHGLTEASQLISVALDVIAARLGLDHDRVFPARFAVPVMARYLHNHGGRFPNAAERDRLLTWYIHAAMWGRYAASTETVLNIDLKAVDERGIDGLMEQMERSRGDLRVREADFGGNTVGARFYPMLYMLSRTRHAKDFGSGIELSAHMLGRNASLQVHHIFPKARLYEAAYGRDQVNAVANYCFLTQDANLEVLDRDPAEYFPAFERRFPGVLSSQWIPMDRTVWNLDSYPQFLAARRQLLADAMNELLAELWSGAASVEIAHAEPRHAVVEVPNEAGQAGALVTELEELGLARGDLDTEVRRPDSGELVGVAEACWPDGLLPGATPPVVLELDGGEDQLNEMATLGYLVFSDVDALRRYAVTLLEDAA